MSNVGMEAITVNHVQGDPAYYIEAAAKSEGTVAPFAVSVAGQGRESEFRHAKLVPNDFVRRRTESEIVDIKASDPIGRVDAIAEAFNRVVQDSTGNTIIGLRAVGFGGKQDNKATAYIVK